jgi:hypothetical protein
MYIVAVAWLYVVFKMSITEQSVTAAILTFLLYGVFPLLVILYLMGTPARRRRRKAAKNLQSKHEDGSDSSPSPTDAG